MELRSDNNNPQRFYLDNILVDISHFLHWAKIGRYENHLKYSGCVSHRIGEIAFTLTSTAEALAGVGYKSPNYEYKPSASYVFRCLQELAGFGYNLFP